MSITSFFLNDQVLESDLDSIVSDRGILLELSAEDLHHANVLRLKTGEHIGVIDGDGVYYECEIVECCSDYISVVNTRRIDRRTDIAEIWMFPGLSKGSKLDDVVRACTEIGCAGFCPVQFSRCVVRLDTKKSKKRVERLQKIAKSAAMQSGARKIPSVNQIITIDRLCNLLQNFDFVVVFWEEAEVTDNISGIGDQIAQYYKDKQEIAKVAIVVGPEGGITSNEIIQIKKAFKDVRVASLGSTILRTETANIVSAANVKYEIEISK